MGKGSKPRPVVKPKYDSNWDEINWKSKPKKDEWVYKFVIGGCDGCGANDVEVAPLEPNRFVAGINMCRKCLNMEKKNEDTTSGNNPQR